MTLYFTILRSRASPADFTAAVAAALFMPFALGPRRPSSTGTLCGLRFCRGTLLCDSRTASPEDTAISDSVVALCFAIPQGRSSPAGPTTAVPSASVVSLSPGRTDPVSPEDTASADAVAELYCAIPRGRASPTGSSTAVAAASVVSLSPDAVEPCPGREPHRQSPSSARPFAAQEHPGSAPRARPGCSTHQPPHRSTWPAALVRAQWAPAPISKATRSHLNDIWLLQWFKNLHNSTL